MMEDWVECELGIICDKALKVKQKLMPSHQKFKYLDIGGIDNTSNRIVSHKEYVWKDAPSRAQQIIKQGDILFSTVRTYLKNIAQVNDKIYDGQICSSGFTVIRGKKQIANPNYLYYLSISEKFIQPLNDLQTGSSYPAVRDKDVFSQLISLPPLPIQRAIVAKIETLFSSLDSGIADLKRAQAQLKIYRQAVLKKAFEGELTAEWRAKQKELPTAEALLAEIKAERERYYAQQIAEWKQEVKVWEENGKEGKKPGKPKKVEEPNKLTEYEIEVLFSLPREWKWVKLGILSIVSGGLTKSSKRKLLDIQLPFLRVANVYFNRLELDEIHEIGIKKDEISRVKLENGDLLLVEGNGSISQIGRVAIWRNEIVNCVHQNHLIKARPLGKVNSKYLLHFLCSQEGRNIIVSEASSTSGLHTLNLTKVANLKIPFSSFKEQHQIVQEIESRLSVCDKVEESISQSLEKAEALRQSILKKAFAGELLTAEEIVQCKKAADYEPASVLLERIKAEQNQSKKK